MYEFSKQIQFSKTKNVLFFSFMFCLFMVNPDTAIETWITSQMGIIIRRCPLQLVDINNKNLKGNETYFTVHSIFPIFRVYEENMIRNLSFQLLPIYEYIHTHVHIYIHMWSNHPEYTETEKLGVGKKMEVNTRQEFVFLQCHQYSRRQVDYAKLSNYSCLSLCFTENQNLIKWLRYTNLLQGASVKTREHEE